MRLDKFLKVSRLIKRRTVANAVSEMGRVLVNGNSAKPVNTAVWPPVTIKLLGATNGAWEKLFTDTKLTTNANNAFFIFKSFSTIK